MNQTVPKKNMKINILGDDVKCSLIRFGLSEPFYDSHQSEKDCSNPISNRQTDFFLIISWIVIAPVMILYYVYTINTNHVHALILYS